MTSGNAHRTPSSLPSTRPWFVFAVAFVVVGSGCQLFSPNEHIVRVKASQNPVEAARLTLLGVKSLDHGDVERATGKFLGAVEADATYGPAHNNLGLIHYEAGNLYQAALAFEQAMDLMPQDPSVYYNLALTLESAGKTFEAIDLYTQAIEMEPDNPQFLGNLVRLRVRMGEDDPILRRQLEELILIESRPDWRRWADRQLALFFNDALDRGPELPDFGADARRERERDQDAILQSKIIDLSPDVDQRTKSDVDQGTNLDDMETPTEDAAIGLGDLLAPQSTEQAPDPAPIQDGGMFEELPPSILQE